MIRVALPAHLRRRVYDVTGFLMKLGVTTARPSG